MVKFEIDEEMEIIPEDGSDPFGPIIFPPTLQFATSTSTNVSTSPAAVADNNVSVFLYGFYMNPNTFL